MSFLKHLNDQKYLSEFDDNSGLPEQSIKELQKLIRSGAENSGKWSNALELVHKAYDIGSVQRPTPDIKSAWKQYETLISFAVEQLSKHHGQNGTWRMTSESFDEKSVYEIGYSDSLKSETYEVQAKSVDQIIEFFKGPDDKYTLKETEMGDSVLIEVWEYGTIKTNINIEIRKLK